MGWIYLAIAIVTEVIGTSSLKAADGFTRLIPSILVVIGYTCSFYFLSLALRSIPVGVAYAIWSGIGIVLISSVAWLVYGQKLSTASLIGMSLIIMGVCVLNLFPKND
jgi:small multidrug resistance pump